jgi:hypothetical protein
MKYMFLLTGDEAKLAGIRPEVAGRGLAMHQALQRDLGDRFVDGHRLRPSAEARTVRPRGQEWLVSDGPFAETREQLGGYYLIEAASLDEAVEWCKRLPPPIAHFEVRPAMTGANWRGPLRGKHRYMLLLVASRERLARLSQEQVFRSIDHHYELSLELAARGRFVSSRGLGPDSGSRTLSLRDGECVVTDGPFAETREVVAGYFVVACDSMDEAVEIAKALCFGIDAVEVRPIWEQPYA